MSFGIYKAGQGYWTRMMTAVGAGALMLAGAMWVWGELVAVDMADDKRLFLQAGVAGAIAIISAIVIYWIVAIKHRSVEFFIATEGEMQKVNWSSRREIVGSTWVVIVVSVIIAAVLFVTDLVFSAFFQWIKVLETT